MQPVEEGGTIEEQAATATLTMTTLTMAALTMAALTMAARTIVAMAPLTMATPTWLHLLWPLFNCGHAYYVQAAVTEWRVRWRGHSPTFGPICGVELKPLTG